MILILDMLLNIKDIKNGTEKPTAVHYINVISKPELLYFHHF